jgi:hypothetical protein
MRLLKVAIISALLTGCGLTGPEATKKEIIQLEYYKDTRTNLCFVRNTVTNSNGFSDNVFANVPCTPEVESLVTK